MTPAPRGSQSSSYPSARFFQRVKARLSNPARLLLMLALILFAAIFLFEGAEWLTADQQRPVALMADAEPSRGSLPDSREYQGKISINDATLQDLQQVSGIGPKLAQAMIDTREEMNGFFYWEEILDVPGIGQKRLDALAEFFYCPSFEP